MKSSVKSSGNRLNIYMLLFMLILFIANVTMMLVYILIPCPCLNKDKDLDKSPELKENFEAVGHFLNGSPEWFIKPEYDMKKWIVNAYPDRIQPACLPYSVTDKYGGDLDLLNYYASANQFWRF